MTHSDDAGDATNGGRAPGGGTPGESSRESGGESPSEDSYERPDNQASELGVDEAAGARSRREADQSSTAASSTSDRPSSYTSPIPRSERVERRVERVARSSDTIKGAAYQGATEAVLAIVIAALIGYWADERYGTAPRWLIVGVVIGFSSFVLRLVRMGKLVAEAGAQAEQEQAERASRRAGLNEKPNDETRTETAEEQEEAGEKPEA